MYPIGLTRAEFGKIRYLLYKERTWLERRRDEGAVIDIRHYEMVKDMEVNFQNENFEKMIFSGEKQY